MTQAGSGAPLSTRRATPGDVDLLLTHVQAGFDSYVAFAPRGWRAPVVASERSWTAEYLADPATWALLAFADDASVGHVAFFPARERPVGAPFHAWREWPVIDGVAHLWQLFVMPHWWGAGVAALLHDAAIAEMRRHGYLRSRLFTPSAHARARRFYERRGWFAIEERFNDGLRLDLTEYYLELGQETS